MTNDVAIKRAKEVAELLKQYGGVTALQRSGVVKSTRGGEPVKKMTIYRIFKDAGFTIELAPIVRDQNGNII